MKDLLLLIVVVIVGYLGYQLFIEDKSIHQVRKEVNEQISDSKSYIAEKYLKQKIPEMNKNGKFKYRDVKCSDNHTYGVSCTITKITTNESLDQSLQFDLTLLGIGSYLEHKIGLFDLNTTNLGIKIDNVDIGTSDSKLRKMLKYADDINAGLYLTAGKDNNGNEIAFEFQGNRNLSISSKIKISKDARGEEIIQQLSECLGEIIGKEGEKMDIDCKEFFNKDFEELAAHIYFEQLDNEINITKAFIDTALSKNERELTLLQIINDDEIPSTYKKTLQQFFNGERSRSQDRITAKRDVSFLDIINAIKNGDDAFFERKFNYEIDGKSYNPWENMTSDTQLLLESYQEQ